MSDIATAPPKSDVSDVSDVRTIRVRFENGVFVPHEPIDLPEGTAGVIEVASATKANMAEDPFPPGHPWHGLPRISHEKAEAMLKAIDEAFGHVDPEDWEDPPSVNR